MDASSMVTAQHVSQTSPQHFSDRPQPPPPLQIIFPNTVGTNLSDRASGSPVNGTQPPPSCTSPTYSPSHAGLKSPTSAIPRLRPQPSAIPHPSTIPKSQPTRDTNNNCTETLPIHRISIISSPIGMPPKDPTPVSQLRPYTPPKPPPIDPPDLVSSTTNTGVSSGVTYPPSSYYAGRSRQNSRVSFPPGRTCSEHPQRSADNESDSSSAFSSSGQPYVITSKINSMKNVHHKPGGGNVVIVDEKVKLGPIQGKCHSLANVKHKPGGGNAKILDEKQDHSTVQPRVGSMQNVKHNAGGGQVQIVNNKLDFTKKAKSRVGSMANVKHRPHGGDVQIFRESLPWLKYNKPNLSAEERARLNKQKSVGEMTMSHHSGSTDRS